MYSLSFPNPCRVLYESCSSVRFFVCGVVPSHIYEGAMKRLLETFTCNIYECLDNDNITLYLICLNEIVSVKLSSRMLSKKHIYAQTHASTHICTYTLASTHVRTHAYTHTHARMHACMHAHMFTCIRPSSIICRKRALTLQTECPALLQLLPTTSIK